MTRAVAVEPEIHPELRRLAAVLPRGASEWSLKFARRATDVATAASATFARFRPGPNPPEVVHLGGPSARIHRPPSGTPKPWPALVWIHGGGYVMGSAAQEDDICRRFADAVGAMVVSVDYRLAPDHPYPTPLEDCHAVLAWTARHPEVDAERVMIGGASAGGGLCAALAILARERGEVRPILQVLTYPMLDDRTVLRDVDERGFRLWNNRANRYGWSSYLGAEPGSSSVRDGSVPARETDLAGLPAAWIGVGTLDLFHDEDLAYAERLRAAGVACEVDEVEGAFHAFDYLAPKTGVGRAFRQAQIDAMLGALDAPEPALR